jgi:phosphopantetheinyl transferase
VWSIRIGSTPDDSEAWAVLDDRQRARALLFRAEVDRHRYIARHAAYRRVLARYLGSEPQDIRIGVTPSGRPHLSGVSGIDFNTSHTGDLAVIAIARGRRVGVDVERIRDIADVADLAAAHFTRRERDLLGSTDARTRSALFLAIWTAKEAAVKATGIGLSLPLLSFDTGLPGGGTWGPVPCDVDGTPITLQRLDTATGHVGTIALQGGRADLEHLVLSEAAI